MNYNYIIPKELIEQSNQNEDVNIIVGDNGSGKSQMLSYLADWFKKDGKTVIIIANSIYDKFETKGNKIFELKDSFGRRKSKIAIKKTLLNVSNKGISRLKIASDALYFADFDPMIGIKVNGFNPTKLQLFLDETLIPKETKEDISALIYKLDSQNVNEILWLQITNFNFSEIDKSIYTRLAKYENILRKFRIIKDLDFFLSKNYQTIPLMNASSGELSVISTVLFIATTIDEETVILIDEPENSLHPKWQKNYIDTLLNNFYKYSPKIICATHSPLILNGAETSSDYTKVFKAKNFQLTIHDNQSNNIEDAFADYFDIITPENKILTNRIKKYMNELVEGEINNLIFNSKIEDLKKLVYDDKQKTLLENIIRLGLKISNENYE
jgi:predicted ATPase